MKLSSLLTITLFFSMTLAAMEMPNKKSKPKTQEPDQRISMLNL